MHRDNPFLGELLAGVMDGACKRSLFDMKESELQVFEEELRNDFQTANNRQQPPVFCPDVDAFRARVKKAKEQQHKKISK